MSSLNCLINKDGSIEQELSFDAWCLSDCWRRNRRDPVTWQNLSTAPTGLITDRGYTGHLHLDGFKLINLGGRVYDPVLGRFLSPDNFVQDVGSSQDYNRYSYCVNNPLKYTDPSGELFLGTILTAVGDFFAKAFLEGGLDQTSKSERNHAWKMFDPTVSWSLTNKAWKIDIGGFKTDPIGLLQAGVYSYFQDGHGNCHKS